MRPWLRWVEMDGSSPSRPNPGGAPAVPRRGTSARYLSEAPSGDQGHQVVAKVRFLPKLFSAGEYATRKKFWDIFKQKKATTFGGVPFIFEILKKLRLCNMDLPYLKYVTQAG